MKKIIFRVGDENRVVVEQLKGNGIDESIFSEQYHKALHVMDSYLSHRFDNGESSDYNNNVFAFVGERGSGKTSCMTSVAKYLESNDISDFYPCLKSNTFCCLQLIDPTFFCNDKESIVGHILSQLLKDFKDTREKKKINGSLNSLLEQEIVEKFQEVSSNIDCLRQDKNMTPDDMEYLNQLSSAVRLRDNIRELVQKLLLYRGNQNAIYVIPIDDIDMNKEGVTRIVEDIRKYLSNENLLVLVAVHLDQLVLIEKQEYYSQYKTLLDRNQILPSRIDEMTEKFMDKFLPHAHRIIMPEGSSYLCAPMEIIDGECKYPYVSVRQGVCEMIFAKTRYLFYNSNDTASRIIPQNLRNLRHFIGFLYNMSDYNVKRNVGHTTDASGLYNKSLFKKYLFSIWCEENLEEGMRQDVSALLRITDITLFNSHVIGILCRYFNDLKLLTEEPSDAAMEVLNGIRNIGNKNYNISAGDSLNIIFLLEGLTSDEKKCNLLFLLKSIYSIKLYEFYDERTEEINDDKTEEELLLDERIASYNLSNYEKFVAGSFINPLLYNLLPNEKYSSISRQYRAVNLAGLTKLISECVNHWDDIPAAHIRLCEFFMLSISRSFDSKNRNSKIEYVDPYYRKKTDPYYAKAFKVREVNGCFDANAILFNSTRVEQCYGRFPRGNEFFAKADTERDIEDPKSLWAKFKKETLLRDGQELDYSNFERGRWLSWVSIRNAEILQQLLNVLSFSKEDARHAQGDKNILANYYDRMSKFSIMNYDHRGDNGEFFKIEYSFTKCVSQALKDSNQNLFDELFVSMPDIPLPYEAIFDTRRQIPYKKNFVRNKLYKYGSDHELIMPQDIIEETLNNFEGETIPSQDVVELVNRINARLKENGSTEENA